MNNITITGNLVRNINDPNNTRPVYGQLQNGNNFYNNAIGFDMGYFNKETNTWVSKPEFLEIKAFSGIADNLAKNYQKGDGVLISGEMRADRYTDQNGQSKTAYYILVSKVERCNKKNPHAEQNASAVQTGMQPIGQPAVAAQVTNAAQPVVSAPDSFEGLPFV